MSYDLHGCRRLIAGVIEQAVSDLRGLENSGWLILENGFLKVNPAKAAKYRFEKSLGYNRVAEVQQLLHFFGQPLEMALSLAGINVSPQSIRRKLKIKPLENYDSQVP